MSTFDPWQFAGRKSLAVEAHYTTDGEFESTGLDYGDYGRMHTAERAPRHKDCVPPFAHDTEQLKKVLMLRALRYLRGTTPIRELHNADWEQLNRRATEKALRGYKIRSDAPRVQHEMQARHRASVRRAGGFLQLLAAIAYRAWRLGQDSVAVGESLGISPVNVRATLQRLRDSARQLGFDVGLDRRSETRKYADDKRLRRMAARKAKKAPADKSERKPQPKPVPKPVPKPQPKPKCQPRPKPERKERRKVDVQKVAALRNRGLTFHAIAKEIGFCCPEIRRAVRLAGVQLPPARGVNCYRSPLAGFDGSKIVELYRAGKSVSEIASSMGYPLGAGQNRVRYTLVRAGVYVPKANRAA
jgi:hypothetical protein